MTKIKKPGVDWELFRLLAERRKKRSILDVFREEFELLHGSGKPPGYAKRNVVFLLRRPGAFTRLLAGLWGTTRRALWNSGTALVKGGASVFKLGSRLRKGNGAATAPPPGLTEDAKAASPRVEPEPTADPEWQEELRKIHALPEGDLTTGSLDKRRTALCISGGGIRSAVFSLGVLQGLARRNLLKDFHYISTVSGGGYIGSWLSALLTRKRQSDLRPASRSEMEDVTEVLSKADQRREDPEKLEIRHLREYSNYLAPKLGLFSADMFSLVATAIRNVILNWLTLVPIVTASLLFPLAYGSVIDWCDSLPADSVDVVLTLVCGAGSLALLTCLGSIATYLDQSTVKTDEKSCPQSRFVKRCLAPLFLASLLFTAFSILQFERRGALFLVVCSTGLFALLHFLASAKGAWGRTVKQFLVRTMISAVMGAVLGLAYGTVICKLIGDVWPVNIFIVLLTGPLVLPLTYWLLLVLRSGIRWYAAEGFREWIARAQGWLLIVCIGWTALGAIGLFGHQAWEALGSTEKLGLASFTSLLGWGAAALGSSKNAPVKTEDVKFDLKARLAKKMVPLISIAFLALLLSGMCTLAILGIRALSGVLHLDSTAANKMAATLIWMFGLAAFGVFVGFFVGINTFSLHSMYGNRLVRAFLGASRWRRKGLNLPNNTDYFTGFSTADDLQMTSLVNNKPYPVINVALNLVSTQRKAWQQRKAESFVMSPLHCGSSTTGYRFTGEYMCYENGVGVSLGRAMTISGAAASPNSGYHSSPIVTFLMTLFNLRLGWWAPNPANEGFDEQEMRLNEPASSASMFLQEALGMTTDKSKWVHLSDGGHFENLGLYEMVRRRCHFIVAIDAGCDPDREFEDLGGAIRKVRIDFGVIIEMSGINVGVKSGKEQTRCALGRIQYSSVDAPVGGKPAPDGYLLYIKPAVFDKDPVDVRNYKAQETHFPHESTSDQFFSESQFESYRALGSQTIHDIWNCTGARGTGPLTDLFELSKTRILQSEPDSASKA